MGCVCLCVFIVLCRELREKFTVWNILTQGCLAAGLITSSSDSHTAITFRKSLERIWASKEKVFSVLETEEKYFRLRLFLDVLLRENLRSIR